MNSSVRMSNPLAGRSSAASCVNLSPALSGRGFFSRVSMEWSLFFCPDAVTPTLP